MQPSPSGLRVIPEGQMHMKVPIKFLHIMPLDSQSWRPSAHSSRSVKIHVFEHPFSSFIYWRQPALFHEKNASRLSYETRTKKKTNQKPPSAVHNCRCQSNLCELKDNFTILTFLYYIPQQEHTKHYSLALCEFWRSKLSVMLFATFHLEDEHKMHRNIWSIGQHRVIEGGEFTFKSLPLHIFWSSLSS